METTSIRFADAARHLGEAARSQGLVVPAFRSPPRCGPVTRSIQRRRDGGATVSVALRGRPWPAVLADLIEGVIAANRLAGEQAAGARDVLWEAAGRSSLLGSGWSDGVVAPAPALGRGRPRSGSAVEGDVGASDLAAA